MRLWAFGLWCALVLPCSVQGFAQQAVPRTLETLAQSSNAENTPAVPGAEAKDAGPKRPAGTVARPKDGVQHPDLDKAWADYDAAVTKAAEGIRAVINKQFDAATNKGDLDAAEKWQAALGKFEKDGEVPAEKEAKAAVSATVADYTEARGELASAYEAVVRNLTKEKKIAEAKACREELRVVIGAGPKLVNEWSVLFRSDNPGDWAKEVDFKDRHAVPLSKAPRNIRFLRLKRVSVGNTVIIPMSDEMLGKNGAVSEKYGWAGGNQNGWGGHHLGVYQNHLTPSGNSGGAIWIHFVGYDGSRGWGFGHKVHANDRQYCSWGSIEIPREVFEVSVKCSDLTAAEKKSLLK